MVPLAPRYDRRIVDLLRALDDREVPIAEVVRRVGAAAERLELPRPSYVHLRRYVHDLRARQDEVRAIAEEVAGYLVKGRLPNAYALDAQVRAGRFRR